MPSPLDRLDELLAAATPGPWQVVPWREFGSIDYQGVTMGETGDVLGDGQGSIFECRFRPNRKADAEFVVWLVNHAAGLARIARAAEAYVAASGRPLQSAQAFDALREALAGLDAASEDAA